MDGERLGAVQEQVDHFLITHAGRKVKRCIAVRVTQVDIDMWMAYQLLRNVNVSL